jgi:hypothetical protein
MHGQRGYGEQRGLSCGVSAEIMTAPGGTAHLAWRGPAVLECGSRAMAVDGSLGSGRQSVAAGDGEAWRGQRGDRLR